MNFAKFLRTLFYRSSHWKCSVKKGFLKIYYNKTPALEFLFNKVAGSQACNFIKKKLQCRCFPVKFAKFLQTSILTDIYERLRLFLKENIHQPLVGFRFVFISRFRILIYCIFLIDKLDWEGGKISSCNAQYCNKIQPQETCF